MNDLAARQLEDLAAASDGAIEILATEKRIATTTFEVSLDTHGLSRSGRGIRVLDRERFTLMVSSTFPFAPPSVSVHHRRWVGTPHVQWGTLLCLYAAPSVEWNPADGMRGLIERLTLWLERAAEGALDADGQPLHPPVAYASGTAGSVVIRPDFACMAPWSTPGSGRPTAMLFAWCRRNGSRVDVEEWLTGEQAAARAVTEAVRDERGQPFYLAPVIAISEEIGFEYPATAAVLARALDVAGISGDAFLEAVTAAAGFNLAMRTGARVDPSAPVLVLLATPSRGIGGSARLPHFAAWRFDDLDAKLLELLAEIDASTSQYAGSETADRWLALQEEVATMAREWLEGAKTAWMTVFEERAEVTHRRDEATASNWLRGKRILILGCGALGAPIAEHCARAGAAAMTIADNGIVHPGILVRQPYDDTDIDQPKASALARRLRRIRPDLAVEDAVGDVVARHLTATADMSAFDLVIDATADTGVRAALETARARRRGDWPPVVTALFGHTSQRALVTVSLAGASGAAHDVLRRLAIDLGRGIHPAWSDVADDFFRDPPRTELFLPEPGCSAPTFVGGAAQTGALASLVLTEAVQVLAADPATIAPMTVTALRLPDLGCTASNVVDRLSWPNDVLATDHSTGIEVRIARRALAEMRAETRRGARLRGERVETGGMLLGAFDDATQTVIVDLATGPTPDSKLSEVHFTHGTAGSQQLLDNLRAQTGDRVGFLGMWHTHPFGPASPSSTDTAGMAYLTSPDGTSRRSLMLILGGDSPDWNAWHDHGTPPPLYVQVVDRRRPGLAAAIQPAPPPGRYFPGGYRTTADNQLDTDHQLRPGLFRRLLRHAEQWVGKR
ncbi:ThiF family adenylyltransferase [Nocardia sp. CA2R105]|uniref:ThiF family adenylyltransferase n=1 Tax=Nocardia coffeae TaxID=2873381 RepID=UPI001CA65620|nr:ThiF family adenylyltransferase [Nocardia coffeae]MBY8861223.1 ThiF family adenylyltransferase [Nocardia coffeae]